MKALSINCFSEVNQEVAGEMPCYDKDTFQET